MLSAGSSCGWPKNSPVDVEKLGVQSLIDPSVRKIAIANPEHAPYGRAAVSAMEHFGLYEAAKNKLVLGENISQAAQFVQSGAAQIGIIAFSIALSDPMPRNRKVLADSARCLSTYGPSWSCSETSA